MASQPASGRPSSTTSAGAAPAREAVGAETPEAAHRAEPPVAPTADAEPTPCAEHETAERAFTCASVRYDALLPHFALAPECSAHVGVVPPDRYEATAMDLYAVVERHPDDLRTPRTVLWIAFLLECAARGTEARGFHHRVIDEYAPRTASDLAESEELDLVVAAAFLGAARLEEAGAELERALRDYGSVSDSRRFEMSRSLEMQVLRRAACLGAARTAEALGQTDSAAEYTRRAAQFAE